MTDKQQTITALVLAGSRQPHDPVAAFRKKSLKAFADIGGHSMLKYVLHSLSECERIDRILVCIPEDADFLDECPDVLDFMAEPHIERIAPKESPSASVCHVMETETSGDNLLVTTADHPLLSKDILDQFLDVFFREKEDVMVALTAVDMIEGLYPQVKRTRIKLEDDDYTGCNLFGLRGENAIKAPQFWKDLDQYRKRPWRIAMKIGLWTLFLFLIKKLTLRQAMERLGKRVGVSICPVVILDPHAGIDVDTLRDYDIVSHIIYKDTESFDIEAQAAEFFSPKDLL
mgnify:CR=1 FL=1